MRYYPEKRDYDDCAEIFHGSGRTRETSVDGSTHTPRGGQRTWSALVTPGVVVVVVVMELRRRCHGDSREKYKAVLRWNYFC
mmetsp:Transcript_9257/g.21033  ORF Transcript_9257/g.21033 Transcript_9257/m.21033 type:complete len:82 (+) Transcript_9257:325-570(+)